MPTIFVFLFGFKERPTAESVVVVVAVALAADVVAISSSSSSSVWLLLFRSSYEPHSSYAAAAAGVAMVLRRLTFLILGPYPLSSPAGLFCLFIRLSIEHSLVIFSASAVFGCFGCECQFAVCLSLCLPPFLLCCYLGFARLADVPGESPVSSLQRATRVGVTSLTPTLGPPSLCPSIRLASHCELLRPTHSIG